jgi:hypothetical protein
MSGNFFELENNFQCKLAALDEWQLWTSSRGLGRPEGEEESLFSVGGVAGSVCGCLAQQSIPCSRRCPFFFELNTKHADLSYAYSKK